MTGEVIRVLDTGTRSPEQVPQSLDVRHQPALLRRPLEVDEALIADLFSQRHHIVFYSRFAAQVVLDLNVIATDADHQLWAVGQKTAALLGDHFKPPIGVPEDERFSGLRRLLSQCDEALPIAAFGLQGKPRDLDPVARDWGVGFTAISVYESVAASPDEICEAFDSHRPHWLTVTSSRGIHSIADAMGAAKLQRLQSLSELRVAAIGPSTAQSIRDYEIAVDLVSDSPDREGLLEAIADTL